MPICLVLLASISQVDRGLESLAYMHPSQRLSQSVVITPASAMSAPIMRPQIAVIPPAALISLPNARPHIGIMGSTTPPVSGPLMAAPPVPGHVFLDSPTEMDIARTHALEQFQNGAELILTEKEEAKRRSVLAQLEKIVKLWARRVTWERGLPKDLKESSNAKIFTFGSYQLGVHGPEADIDALCVGPCYATLEDDFFLLFCTTCSRIHLKFQRFNV